MSAPREVLVRLTESELNTLLGATLARVNYWDDEARKQSDPYEREIRESISRECMDLWTRLFNAQEDLV